MELNELCDLKDFAQEKGILFFYSGYFSQRVLLATGEVIRQKMDVEHLDQNVTKKVFSIFVEQVQNIIRYSDEKIAEDDQEMRYGIVLVGRTGDRFFVACGNIMPNNDVPRLEEALSKIAKMDQGELKVLYKEKLRAGPDEHSKGAGIGFIEIARRATGPIEFAFRPVDDTRSFFTLKAYI